MVVELTKKYRTNQNPALQPLMKQSTVQNQPKFDLKIHTVTLILNALSLSPCHSLYGVYWTPNNNKKKRETIANCEFGRQYFRIIVISQSISRGLYPIFLWLSLKNNDGKRKTDSKVNPTTNYNFMEDKTKYPKKKRKNIHDSR